MEERLSTHQSGMAGEFFVMEVLFRLGYEPALTLGNAKNIDILVQVSPERTIKISVKTVRGGGKWGVGKENFAKFKDMFFVFLLYNRFKDVKTRPDAFIIPASEVEKLKEEWLDDSFAVYYSKIERRKKLEKYLDKWDLIK